MEQYSDYLMRMHVKSNNIYTNVTGSLHFEQSTSIQSWEEQAFAEDIRELGGFVWPPRCYSCSFCNRIFKSAQALGGHMNVHRRDRARLNQPLCLKTSGSADDHKLCISDSSNVPSEVLPPFYAKTESVSIIQGELGTKKVACMNHILMKESTVETDLSVGLNFYVPTNREAEHSDGCGDIKRRKMDRGAPLPLLYIACSATDKEIDLELRLGDSPTVN